MDLAIVVGFHPTVNWQSALIRLAKTDVEYVEDYSSDSFGRIRDEAMAGISVRSS